MDKKSILELKRRMKKDGCTFSRITGCYVDGYKNKVVTFSDTFLNLEENEFFKYLEIAKKSLSGAIGNNMLEIEFPKEEEEVGGHQQFLMGLKASALKDEGLLDSFYDMVIENYEYVGNYLILLFHDAYDVMTKTTDNSKLDESEEVYEYIICAICPVTLTKAGLGYIKYENRIGTLDRDWAVEMPQTAFTFPAFSERSSDIHSVMFYTKDTKKPHEEVINNILGCRKKQTATQKQNAFKEMIIDQIGEEKHKEIEDAIVEKLIEEKEKSFEAMEISGSRLASIMMESGIDEAGAEKIAENYTEVFADDMPDADTLIDPKVLRARENKIARKELECEVEELKKELEAAKNGAGNGIDSGDEMLSGDEALADAEAIVVSVSEKKKEEIRTQIIDGQKCIVIPMYADEKFVLK